MALPAPDLTLSIGANRKEVEIDATPPAGATGLEIWRVSPSGNEARVRAWAPGAVVAGTPIIARDYEAPLGVELVYYAHWIDTSGAGADSAGEPITVPASDCEAWLVDLARPVNSLPTLIESLDEIDYDAANGVHRVLQRRAPVLTSLPAYTPTGELIVLSDDLGERDLVRALLGSGFPFLLRTTPALGIGNLYCGMTGFVEGRIVTAGVVEARRFRISIVQVERPDPSLFVPAAPNSWENVAEAFVDWAEVLSLAGTWDQLANTYPANPWANPVLPWLPDDV
jgi:hypothetical protein